MRYWAKVLCFLAFGAGAAWAQTVTVISAATPGMATTVVCPPSAAMLPALCPAVVSRSVTGEPVLLVLGREEEFAIANAPVGNVNWSNVPSTYASVFEQGNPLTYMRVNGAVTRHGNPYYPYYVLGTSATIAGLEEMFVAGQTTTDAEILQMVTARYRGLTTDQAQVLGYQQAGAFTPGVGQVYLNTALVDNRFNALMPEAFIFGREGNLLGVQYYVVSSQQVTLFGQTARSSTMLTGAQQVTVWLYTDNPGGRFAPTNPRIN
jgi:hypothetical protein